jgi:uncharacterized membrane protein
MRSRFLRLNTLDFTRGLTLVIICTLITGIYQLIVNRGVVNWLTFNPVVIATVGSGISYLTKNLLTNSQGHFLKMEKRDKPEEYGVEIL